jgi:hypothetical protein
VLRIRRRIVGQFPDWALSADGLRTLRQTLDINAVGPEASTAAAIRRAVPTDPEGEGCNNAAGNLPGVDYAAIDAVLARSEAAIENATRPGRAQAVDTFTYTIEVESS